MRTREIATQVGVNIATLHYYFPTKEALIREVVQHAMQRFRSTLQSPSSAGEHLKHHLRAVRALLRNEPELGAVMAELALRSARDPALARIMREMNEAWYRTLRGLLRRAVKDGQLAPELDSDGVAALIMATFTSMTLPTLATSERGEGGLRQLERWLELR